MNGRGPGVYHGLDGDDKAWFHALVGPSRKVVRDLRVLVHLPAGPVTAVRDVTLRVTPGEHTAISGPSGCGKSTLLHMIGCVDTPSSGVLLFEGQEVSTLNDRARSLLRLTQIGFVFQRFFLITMLTAGSCCRRQTTSPASRLSRRDVRRVCRCR